MLEFYTDFSTDYVTFRCSKCNSVISIKYLGLDPTIPRIEAKCEKCKKRGEYKIKNIIEDIT